MPIDTVVFVPGICGSVLVDHGETIWPGTPGQVVFQSYPDRLVQILSSSTTIEATDVLRSVPLTLLGLTVHHFAGYGQALKVLEQMGYSEVGGSLIPFPYDWRKDIRESAKLLHGRLSQPDLRGRRVAIVAHSMGGLVSRFALEKLGIPVGLNLQLLALLATPHLGAPVVMQNVLGLRPEIFLSAKQCRDALQNPQFPSAYQLLPGPACPRSSHGVRTSGSASSMCLVTTVHGDSALSPAALRPRRRSPQISRSWDRPFTRPAPISPSRAMRKRLLSPIPICRRASRR
jgi:pimeloyl-ACP methyl ester carboxylesterase